MGVTTTAATAPTPREKSATKKVNKWDAVMSKINYQDPKIKSMMNGKEVKSKVPHPQHGSQQQLVPPHTTTSTAKVRRSPSRVVPTDNVTLRHRQLTQLRNERNNSTGPGTNNTANNASHHRTILIDSHENDAYSVQSSTESESSLPESSGPSSTSLGKSSKNSRHISCCRTEKSQQSYLCHQVKVSSSQVHSFSCWTPLHRRCLNGMTCLNVVVIITIITMTSFH